MRLQSEVQKYTLQFKFNAGTSRGILKTKETWFLKIWDENNPLIVGIGEAGPLKGLSIDDRPDFEKKIKETSVKIADIQDLELFEIDWLAQLDLQQFPSIKFAVETALLDMMQGGKRQLFQTAFSEGKEGIPVNGLVWMGEAGFMKKQIQEKIDEGYSCIKIKVGAIDFDAECKLLEGIRKHYGPDKITLRLDANGAFSATEALEKLKILSSYHIHSIEQPIKEKNMAAMHQLCAESPIPIALDEELIGLHEYEQKKNLLKQIRPQYIIIKPTLLGGLAASAEWIELASHENIKFWITSALESNIGLNAIAQFTSSLNTGNYPQGLGTGQLYLNNISSPLVITKGNLQYDYSKSWDLRITERTL